MKKPIHIKQITWDFLLPHLRTLNNHQRRQIISAPGKFLCEIGWDQHPHLIRGTVIELPNEVEYVIEAAGAAALVRGDAVVELERLYDHKMERHPLDTVRRAIKHGATFDQID